MSDHPCQEPILDEAPSAFQQALATAAFTRVCDLGRNLPFDEIVGIIAAVLAAAKVVDPEIEDDDQWRKVDGLEQQLAALRTSLTLITEDRARMLLKEDEMRLQLAALRGDSDE